MKHPPLFTEYLEKLKLPLQKKMSLHQLQAARYFSALDQAPVIKASTFDYENPTVRIGTTEDVTAEESLALLRTLDVFRPWRKGPFSLFGIEIDAEWRSDMKWNRIAPILGNLTGKRVCDVGCGNGYFMYRMLSHNPQLVLGLDPTWRYYANFLLLQKYAREERLHMLPLGWQELTLLKKSFDLLLAMGIVYHHRDPVAVLENCRQALDKKGIAVIESMTVPGEEPIAWTPGRRYANVSGIWFVPTAAALEVWLKKAGFRHIQRISHIQLTTSEQRRTAWADVPSLAENLSPDGKYTIEGYPPPWRTIYTALS